ncbi:MAG: cohesin domain-containing protein [Nitrospirota bacterium]
MLTACGSGGGGGASQTDITASFAPDAAAPSSNSLSLTPQLAQGDLIMLNVAATSLATPSSGAAFDVEFDPSLVNFIGFAPGTFFESSGSVAYQAALQGGSDNRLVVGITQQAGTGVSGSGNLIELHFKVLGIGSSALTFANNNLTDPSGNLIPALTWSGGTLSGS